MLSRFVCAAARGAVALSALAGSALGAESVLYGFAGDADGRTPSGKLIADAGGNLYGTTVEGGAGCATGCGTVFELTPPAPGQTVWTKRVLYAFAGGDDGANPQAGLIADASGNLYGVTRFGGAACPAVNASGCGTIFRLAPPPPGKSKWTEHLLHRFKGGADGADPRGELIASASGVLYGTTASGGGACPAISAAGCGTVFQLTPPPEGHAVWIEHPVHKFKGGKDGADPAAALLEDDAGNLFGTALHGGNACPGIDAAGCGAIFKLAPPAPGRTKWSEQLLHKFGGGDDGAYPQAALSVDAGGIFYGTTTQGGGSCPAIDMSGCGTAFKLTPPADGRSVWIEHVLHKFTGGSDGAIVEGGLVENANGALFGVTAYGGGACPAADSAGCGTLFSLTPPAAGHTTWKELVLHAFTGGDDGAGPQGALLGDASGAFYGTASAGGGDDGGAVFALVP